MDSVALPPEGADIYIPTISGAESSQEQHPMQMPAILSYAPAAIGAPPLVAARRAIVAADTIPGAPILQYRTTTLCTQVQFAQTTFHYPPTPPIEATEMEKGQPTGSPQLPMDAEGHMEKTNPFPSLPTPPDLTSISAPEQCPPPSATVATSPPCMDACKQSPTMSNPSPWQTAPNFCIMSQPAVPFGGSVGTSASAGANSNSIAARRQAPQPPALYYPYAEKMSPPLCSSGSPVRRVPPLVKDCGLRGMGMNGGERV